MSEHAIAAKEATTVEPAERQRRVGSVYVLLLDLAREKRAAEQGQADIVAKSAN